MSYQIINEENKIRISLSTKARQIMLDDMEIFCTQTESAFINTVFQNFYEEANSSLSLFAIKRKLYYNDILAHLNSSKTTINEVIDTIIEKEIHDIIDKSHQLSNLDNTSKLYRINNHNLEILYNDDCNEEIYYKKPGSYIRYVIEEYCALPFIDRERIFRQEIYNVVEQACKNRNVLKVKTRFNSTTQTVYIYPYKIVEDPYHTQSYLACYAASNNDINNSYITSYSMSRLNKPILLKQKFHFTTQQISNIEKRLINNSAAYLIEESEQILVELTEKGKQFYRNKLFSRPIKIESLSSDNVYVFNCSKRQIFNYFCNFGKDAKIISPESLRKQFYYTYRKAYKSYERDKDI